MNKRGSHINRSMTVITPPFSSKLDCSNFKKQNVTGSLKAMMLAGSN